MVFRIIVAGESQCDLFAETCLVADYLKQSLPDFCYERIEKSVIEWKPWLCKVNHKNNWHHIGSPLVWKELLMSGSKPTYIGGAQEFLEYCFSYYQFDVFLASDRFRYLSENFIQYQKKIKHEKEIQLNDDLDLEQSIKNEYSVCISGAGNPLTMYIISGLLELSFGKNNIKKIYIYDKDCTKHFMELVEKECSYIGTKHPGKIVKFIEKLGIALTNTDILILMDHIPFQSKMSIGEWLHMNKELMENVAIKINASAALKMRVILPNLGPACYNATMLREKVTNINKNNIVVVTSDLGMDVAPFIAEIAEVPIQNLYCPPVWGFVGINHLIDVNTTVHRYDSFKPYERYTKVRNSTLCIGTLTPEMRTMEYLLHFDDSLWKKIGERNIQRKHNNQNLNVAIAVINCIRIWLFDTNPDYIMNLGIHCDGSFGLSFHGVFSQPAHLFNGEWRPASNFLLPKDPYINIIYLQEMAEAVLKLNETELPPIIEYTPCTCKRKYYVKKGVW